MPIPAVNRAHVEEFARRQKRQIVASILVFPVLAVTMLKADEKSAALFGLAPQAWVPIAALLLIGLVVFSLHNWRCPACNRYLGKGFGPRYCPKCGVQLKA